MKKTVIHTNRMIAERPIDRHGLLTSSAYKLQFEESQKQFKRMEVKEYLGKTYDAVGPAAPGHQHLQ